MSTFRVKVKLVVTVLDPFVGTGSTAVAAVSCGPKMAPPEDTPEFNEREFAEISTT
jgi:hypothetical protein